MDKNILNNISKAAKGAARKAGVMLKKEYDGFDRSSVQLKHQREIVTRFDIASERIIMNEVRKVFPDHQVLSEEAGFEEGGAPYLWIVDPIDGTTNFSMHNPLFSVSIGVATLRDGRYEMVCGIVHAPLLGETFSAIRGGGAFLNNNPIRVSNFRDGKVIHAFCHGREDDALRSATKYFSHQKESGFDCRQMGSAAIELGYVAAGRIESLTIPGVKAWDVAAGSLIVEEAGGVVTDLCGKRWGLESEDIIASNGLVHEAIVKFFK